MRSEIFEEFIHKGIDVSNFLTQIQSEINEFIRTKQIDGASSIISVEGKLKDVSSEDFITLFTIYIEGEIGEWELSYILQWLEMIEPEFNAVQEEIVSVFSTPEINYPISKKNIEEAIKVLRGEKKEGSFEGKYDPNNYSSKLVINLG